MDTAFPASPQGPSQPPTPPWRLRDVFRAVPLSLDLEKLVTGAAGLFLSAFVFGNLYWLGLLTGEKAALRVFSILGIVLASCVWVLFSGILAKMNLTEILEGRKCPTSEIRRFVGDRWTTLIGTPIAFGGLSLLFLIVMAMIEVVGAVPGIGPILFSASFLLVFLLAFTAALTALVHAMGAFLYPSIVALKGSGATAVVMEMFELVRKKGFQLIVYEAVVGVVGFLMTALIGFVVWAGLYVASWSALTVMKDQFSLSMSAVPRFFRVFLRPFEAWLPEVPLPADLAWHYDLAGFLLGFSLLWIVIATAVYPYVFFNAAGSITYLVLRDEEKPAEQDS